MARLQWFRWHQILLWGISFAGLALGLWWSLPSSAQTPAFTFGLGQGLEFVDPDGRNQLSFWITTADATVDFTLYGLTPVELLARYGQQQPWAEPQIDVSGLPTIASWQQQFSGADLTTRQPVTLPTGVASGLYVIQAAHANLGQARTLVAVGRTALVVKQGAGGQMVAWASTLQSGTPVPGMMITLYDGNGNAAGNAVTDANGLVTITSSGAPVMAFGQLGNETTLAGLDWQWQTGDGYGYWYTPTQNSYTIFLHTERPLYHPGDTIYYNAIIRTRLTNGYAPLAVSQPISITLRDARDNLVATAVQTVNEFGTLAGEFALGHEAPLGQYWLELLVNGQSQRQPLQVSTYRKPEYAVTVTTPADFAIAGEELPITVSADYFFGQPVSAATVVLEIYRQADFGWATDPFHNAPMLPYGLVTQITGVTDSAGHWTTTFVPDAGGQADAHYRFYATVTDARNLPVTGEQTLPVYWNAYRLRIDAARYGYRTTDTVTAHLQTQTHAGLPQAGQSITVRVVRDDWQAQTTTDLVPPQSVTTDAAGTAQVSFDALPVGWHRLVATGVDERGRTVTASRPLWVYDDTGGDWWYATSDQLSISADRASYAPGETATLLIQSRVQGMALLTLERAGVYQEQLVALNGPMTSVAVPISGDFAPNLYAKVQLFQRTPPGAAWPNAEGQLLTAQTELVVPATAAQLAVAITPDAPAYRPGQPATLTVRVTDAGGGPVQARVSLALVDEALFALQPDLTADLFATFYGRQPNTVLTSHSLARQSSYSWIDDDGVAAPTATAVATGATTPRRTFLDTAYWNPSLTTDTNGQATVTFTLPDNLTTWRVIARAVTVATQLGETRSKLLVTQEIIAQPVLPRFAVVGDRFAAGLVAHNFSTGATAGNATLDAAGLVILDSGNRSLVLTPGAGQPVQWTTVAAQPGPATVTATLETSAGADQVELPLPVKPFAAPEHWSAAGEANLAATAHFTVPFNSVPEAATLSVRLAPALALGLLDGLDELIDYPYGCVEQTMSRLLPSAVAARAYASLGLPNPKTAEMAEVMNQGLQRLYSFQHEDGSWGWFYDDAGGLYLTAYVLYGLVHVQQAGFTVDEGVIERGFAYLDSGLSVNVEPGARAFALFVKANAGRGDLAQAQALAGQAATLDAAGLAALALALHLEGDQNHAGSVLDGLLAQVQESDNWAYWPLPDRAWVWHDWQTMTSVEKNTAFALHALVSIRPDQGLTPKVVRWLMDHRRGAGWGGYGSTNTQATAFAILGLATYIRHAGELEAAYGYKVLLNGAPIASGEITPATAHQPIPPITVAGEDLQRGPNELRIERTAGSGRLYYSAGVEQQLFYAGFTPLSSQGQGLTLERSYRLVEGQPRADGAYTVGDLVEVTLALQNQEQLAYLLVEDPLPAGFEAINERVNPQMWGDCFWCGPTDRFFWPEWGYNRKEVHDDRVTFFVTELAAGEHRFTYQMRAVTAGQFSVLPGQAYPMYHEAIWGRSASAQVVINPEGLAGRPALAGDFDRSCQISHFDLQQVAGIYGAIAPAYNVTDDATISLRDVVAVAQRLGASCLADQPLPGESAGLVHFDLAGNPTQVKSGDFFTLTVRLNRLTTGVNLGGLGLSLQYDIADLAISSIQWNPALGEITPLGPTMDRATGVLHLGAIDLPAGWPANSPLVTVTFRSQGAGATVLHVLGVAAVDQQNQIVPASSQAELQVVVEGEHTFLPLVTR